MVDTCLWRSWETRIDWTANATVPQDIRDRLTAFLAPVCAVIANLAATLTDATDGDLIAVPHTPRGLVPRTLSVTTPDLSGATPAGTLIAFAMVARSRLFAFQRCR